MNIMVRNYHTSYKYIRSLTNMHKLNNAYNLRAKCGVFASEDLKYYDNIKQHLLDNSQNKYSKNFLTLLTKINSIVSQSLTDTVQKGIFLYYKSNAVISSTLLKKIRFENLKFNTLNNISHSNEIVYLPYINSSIKNKTPKILQYGYPDSYIIHPRTKLNFIIKDNNEKDFSQKYTQMLTNTPLQELIKKKNNIIKKINAFLDKTDGTYDFIFSKDELQNMQVLANKYDAIESLLIHNGINTSSIEAVIFNKINRKKFIPGTKLPNEDTIVRMIQIYDKQKKANTNAFLTFANTDRGYRFKAYKYDKDLYKQIPMIERKYKHYVKTNNINHINNLNMKLSQLIKDNEIAEVYLEEYNQKEMKKLISEDNSVPINLIEKVLQNNEKYYYAKNLKNFNLQKFQNVSTPLINCLKEFGRKNNVRKAFLEAFAFNNIKHSPVFLYLRAGCIPISCQKKDLEKFLHSGYDYKKNVWLMYEL